MPVVYSFNKRGAEARVWASEIAAASTGETRFIPFNHDPYLDTSCYIRAQLLDNLYYEQDPRLRRMYQDLQDLIVAEKATALVVDNCPPYHPEFLRSLDLYRVLRIADGPLSAYDRDFAYAHAYHQVLYHSPAYSRDLGIVEKLHYLGLSNVDFWPLAAFDAAFDPTQSEDALFACRRDLDVVFVGAMHVGKMPLLAEVQKALGRKCVIRGLTTFKRNVYYNLKYGFPGWVSPIAFADYSRLYQRAKIGFNVHNRGAYTTGNFRLFELPANGVMQISDGGEYLSAFFEPGREIIGYSSVGELIDMIRYYLAHPMEREEIARAGYRRVLRDHRLRTRMSQLGELIRLGMTRIGWAGSRV